MRKSTSTAATRALLTCQALNLVPSSRMCANCSSPFKLCVKAGVYKWYGPRYNQGCHECDAQEYAVGSIGFLHGVKSTLWLAKLDCLFMWTQEYTRQQIIRELHPVTHESIDLWISSFQETVSAWFDLHTRDGFESPIFQALTPTSPSLFRKPASCGASSKRPASAKSSKRSLGASSSAKPVLKKPSLKQKTSGRVFIADETHLNKRKPSVLAKHSRPQRDQIWLWGAVLEGHVQTHFLFRVLEHPDDSYDGKPRGHKEMLCNIESLGLQKHDVFVSDKWKATVSAMKAFRKSKRISTEDLPHEIVNHSEGEIKNQNGFTTNPIEAKWSLIKRWVRHRMSGHLPNHSDRRKWRLILNEYQTRNLLKTQSPKCFDRGNITTVGFKNMARLFVVS